MTDRKAALAALKHAVEAGDGVTYRTFADAFGIERRAADLHAWNAYNGSLDAAKALHEAVLPRWDYRIRSNMAWVWRTATDIQGGDEIEDDAGNDIPARAWLLAILAALIAQEEA